jgi:hypothetical protein
MQRAPLLTSSSARSLPARTVRPSRRTLQPCRAIDLDFSDPDTQLGLAGCVLGLVFGIGAPVWYTNRTEVDNERLEELRALNRATYEETGEYMSEKEIEKFRKPKWTDRRCAAARARPRALLVTVLWLQARLRTSGGAPTDATRCCRAGSSWTTTKPLLPDSGSASVNGGCGCVGVASTCTASAALRWRGRRAQEQLGCPSWHRSSLLGGVFCRGARCMSRRFAGRAANWVEARAAAAYPAHPSTPTSQQPSSHQPAGEERTREPWRGCAASSQ